MADRPDDDADHDPKLPCDDEHAEAWPDWANAAFDEAAVLSGALVAGATAHGTATPELLLVLLIEPPPVLRGLVARSLGERVFSPAGTAVLLGDLAPALDPDAPAWLLDPVVRAALRAAGPCEPGWLRVVFRRSLRDALGREYAAGWFHGGVAANVRAATSAECDAIRAAAAAGGPEPTPSRPATIPPVNTRPGAGARDPRSN
jgi:hypothetical protein